jgi:hypothetical protein
LRLTTASLAYLSAVREASGWKRVVAVYITYREINNSVAPM